MPIATQDPDQYASELIDQTETLLANWESRVREKVIPEHPEISSHLLRNNLANLIASIARTIRDPDAEIKSKVINVAHDHANERAKLTDFSLPQILDEYAIFREILFEHLQRPEPLSWELQQRIHRAIDSSVREATCFFIERKEQTEADYRQEREALLGRLDTAHRRLEAVLEQMPVGVTLAERPGGKLIYANQAASQILGHPIHLAADGVGVLTGDRQTGSGALHLDLRPYQQEESPLLRAARDGERVNNEEMLYQRCDDRIINLSVHAAPVALDDNQTDLAVAMFYDISAAKETQAALAQEQEFARVTLDAMGDGVITTDCQGRIERMNPAAERLTGWSRPSARGTPIVDVVRLCQEDATTRVQLPVGACLAQNRQTHAQSLFLLEHSADESTPVTYNLAPIHDLAGDVIGSVTIIHDASLQWRLLQEAAYEAQHDALTDLVNRREFDRRLRLALKRVRAGDEPAALLYLDLDHFKIINDSCGHTAGDALLIELAALLKEHIREQDTLARLGGDEFAIILNDCQLNNALEIANSLRETVKEFVFHWGKQSFHIGVSIGLMEISDSIASVQALLQQVDEACYRAKESGRNRVHMATPPGPGTKPARPRTNWAALVEDALQTDRLQLVGQPIVPLKTTGDQRAGLEFLVRLQGPDDRITRPAAFMPAAERHNLMPALDYWVVKQALAWLDSRGSAVEKYHFYTIKISASTLSDQAALTRLLDLLSGAGVAPARLCFEITELAGTRNLREAAKFVSRLKELGYSVALEDVGGGNASFRHLKKLPVDYLKIDGSFIELMQANSSDLALVRSINEVGHILGKKTIAKRVDSQEKVDQLRSIGVDYAQGYYTGPPVELETLMPSGTG